MWKSWREAGVTNDQTHHQLTDFDFPTAGRERSQSFICSSLHEKHICPVFMLLLGILLVSVSHFCCCMKSLWHMPCTACCTRLLVKAPNKCNVAFILKSWILFVLQHNIFSLLKQRKALEDGETGVMWILWCILMQIHFLFMETNLCRNMSVLSKNR